MPLPPALSSMWRLCKLGYRHEPRLMVAAFVLSQLAALPDALLALWLMLLGKGVLEHRPGMVRRRGDRPRRVGRRDVVSAHGQHARAAPLPRQGDHRARVARRATAGVGRDRRASGTPGVSRPALHAAQSGVRARPHVRVAVFHARVDSAAGRDDGAAGVDSSGAPAAGGVRDSDRVDVDVAAGGREIRAGARGANQSPGAPPVHDRHHRAARQGSAGHRHRQSAWSTERRAAWERWYGPVAAARWGSALWHALAWAIFGLAYVGAVVFVSSGIGAPASPVLLVLAAGARLSAYIGATVGEIGFLRGFWMDGSRRLAWLEDYAASVAASGDLPVPAVLHRGIRLDHVSFAYPGTSRVVLDDVSRDAAGGRGGRDRRREWRRQDDAGQAARRRCTSRRPVRSWWTTRRSRACRRASGGRVWRARSRISSASNSARGTRSVWATSPGWTTSPRWSRRSIAPAPATWSRV